MAVCGPASGAATRNAALRVRRLLYCWGPELGVSWFGHEQSPSDAGAIVLLFL